jgi:hypothetical protein
MDAIPLATHTIGKPVKRKRAIAPPIGECKYVMLGDRERFMTIFFLGGLRNGAFGW